MDLKIPLRRPTYAIPQGQTIRALPRVRGLKISGSTPPDVGDQVTFILWYVDQYGHRHAFLFEDAILVLPFTGAAVKGRLSDVLLQVNYGFPSHTPFPGATS